MLMYDGFYYLFIQSHIVQYYTLFIFVFRVIYLCVIIPTIIHILKKFNDTNAFVYILNLF